MYFTTESERSKNRIEMFNRWSHIAWEPFFATFAQLLIRVLHMLMSLRKGYRFLSTTYCKCQPAGLNVRAWHIPLEPSLIRSVIRCHRMKKLVEMFSIYPLRKIDFGVDWRAKRRTWVRKHILCINSFHSPFVRSLLQDDASLNDHKQLDLT